MITIVVMINIMKMKMIMLMMTRTRTRTKTIIILIIRNGPSYDYQFCLFTIIVKMNRLLSLQVFLDRFVEREIQSLLVHCIHQEEGCDWRDELKKREVTTGILNFTGQMKHHDVYTVLVASSCILYRCNG